MGDDFSSHLTTDNEQLASSTPKKNLWVVTELYYPEETSTGYYLTRIAEGLADRFDIKVICGQPNYSSRGLRSPNHEVRNLVEIFRVPGTTLDKNVIAFRIINMLTLNVSTLLMGLVNFRAGDRVLAVTNPPLMPFAAGLAARREIHSSDPRQLPGVTGCGQENAEWLVIFPHIEFF
jgi:hypothetical protein